MDMTTALTIKAQVVGANQVQGLTNGLKKVEGQSNRAATAMGRLKGAAAGALGVMRSLLPVLGVAAIGKFAKDTLNAADAMSKMSQRTGVAAPQLDKFRKVAELSDTSIEGLGKGFKTLASNMYDAQTKGTGPATEAFKKLGISVTDANGKLKASDQVMLEVADRFKLMKDGPEKAALAADLFGAKIGDELIPLLNSGGDAVRNMSTSLTQEFADSAAAFNDRLENMQEKFGDLGLKLLETLLPTLEKIVDAVSTVVDAFMGLPEPVQNAIIAFGAFKLIAPLFAGIVPAITGIVSALGGIVTALTGGGGALAAIAAVFSGPVGWIALVVAAGVAIYTFRDQIAEAFSFIGDIIRGAWELYKSIYIDPIINAGKMIYEFFQENWGAISEFVTGVFTKLRDFFNNNFIQPVVGFLKGIYQAFSETFNRIGEAIKAPFVAAFNFLKGIVNNILRGIGNAINGVVNQINKVVNAANRAAAAVGLPQIPYIPNVSIPQFAEGGVVTGPTLAMVGEGGQPEYIVPASKAGAFAANWMAGVRGPGAVPRFAEGGMVAPASANVSIQTGPVTQMNGTNFVTTADLSAAVQAGVNQTLDLIRRDGNTRAALGLS